MTIILDDRLLTIATGRAPARRVSTRGRWLVTIYGVTITLGLVFTYLYLTHDIDEPDVSDLAIELPAVPDEENGYLLIAELSSDDFEQGVFDSSLDVEPFGTDFDPYRRREFDPDIARDLVARQRCVLEVLDAAITRPVFSEPPPCASYSSFLASRLLVHVCELRARLLADSGDLRSALREVLKVVRLGERLQNARGDWSTYLRGSVFRWQGIANAQHLAVRRGLDSPSLRDGLDTLNAIESVRSGLDEMLRVEFARQVDFLESLPETWPLFSYWRPGRFYCPNRTKLLLAERYRESRRNVALPMSEQEPVESTTEDTSWRNASGRRFCDSADYTRSVAYAALTDFQLEGVRTTLALRLYLLENGDYPASLSMLVPRYLEKTPVDPFDGEMLRYSKDHRLVWSRNAAKDLNAVLEIPVEPHTRMHTGGSWVVSF